MGEGVDGSLCANRVLATPRTGLGGLVRDDERFMSKALELARAPAFTSPNPRVGALVVRDGRVLGGGFHGGPGSPHAEAAALAGIDAREATLYVNLEPCAHQGRMPPCAPAIAAAGVKRVVAAMEDPDERVRGSGFNHLREQGIEVTTGVLEAEARALNAAYVHHRVTRRPLVTLKLALTLDGRLSIPGRRWITGESTRERVHRQRLEADAVMVGSGTVVADDPLLTVRHVEATRQPTRIVVDTAGRVSPGAALFAAEGNVVIATTDRCPHEQQIAYKEAGAELLVLPTRDGRVDLATLVDRLGERAMLSLFCEGGAALAASLLDDDLVDRLELHYAPVVAGGGPSVDGLGRERNFTVVATERSGDDILLTLERRR